jgi:chromosomal replication initiation ATPase DnaA
MIKHDGSRYTHFVGSVVDEDTRKFYSKKQYPAIWGDKSFVEVAYAEAKSGSKEIKKSGVVEPISIKHIVRCVAQHFQIGEQDVYRARRGAGNKNIPRWIAMKLSQDYSGQKLTEIGKAFGVGNYCTVSQTISRLMRLMASDKKVAK